MIQTGLACILEVSALSVVLVLGMRRKNCIDNLGKHSAVRERTLCHLADGPENALPAVPPAAVPRRLQCTVHVEPRLVRAAGDGRHGPATAREAGEEWRFEDGQDVGGYQVLGLEVVAQVQAAIGIVAKLHRYQDAQHILK